MFDLETSSHFDSIWKHTSCTTKFILTKFYLFKQIHIYKITKNLNTIIDIISWNMWNTIYATCESFTCNMKCIYDMTLDAYAWLCSWSGFSLILKIWDVTIWKIVRSADVLWLDIPYEKRTITCRDAINFFAVHVICDDVISPPTPTKRSKFYSGWTIE